METRRSLLLACLLAAGLVLGVGCGSGSSAPDDDAAAPLLGPAHVGYKSAHCDACHALPVEDHAADRSPTCAACHGGNGACDPNGIYRTRVHAADDACVTCHEDPEPHGYTFDADCGACHFAASGLDETCGEPPDDPPDEPADVLRPESELVGGCFDWPETEFTPDNHAQLTLGLTAGEAAVDFTLRTPDGAATSLADLLLTRPVVLVTGGFT